MISKFFNSRSTPDSLFRFGHLPEIRLLANLALATGFLMVLKINFNEKTFSYPYGGYHSFNKDIEEYLDKINVSFSVNVEERKINFGRGCSLFKNYPSFQLKYNYG